MITTEAELAAYMHKACSPDDGGWTYMVGKIGDVYMVIAVFLINEDGGEFAAYADEEKAIGDDMEELATTLERMTATLKKPVVDIEAVWPRDDG